MLLEAPNMAAVILQSSLRDYRCQENAGTPQSMIDDGAKQRWRWCFRHLRLSCFPSRAVKADGRSCQQIRLCRPGVLCRVPQVISNACERSVLPCQSKQEVGLTSTFCLRNTLSGTPRLCLGGQGAISNQ